MCIYCGTKNYRGIYQHHHGPIPLDENGRTFEIHHVDGNHSNNEPSNLIAVSIQEHYNIHLKQGDNAACLLISKNLDLTKDEKSKLAKEAALRRVHDGTHPWLGPKINADLVSKGIHPFLKINQIRIENGTHHFLCSNYQSKVVRERVENGTHHLLSGKIQSNTNKKLLEQGKHNSQIKITCPHCNKTIDKMNYKRWHGDRCRTLLVLSEPLETRKAK